MTRSEMIRRLSALERAPAGAKRSDPARVYQWLAERGHSAPQPLSGESLPAWLVRVPDAAINALMDARHTR